MSHSRDVIDACTFIHNSVDLHVNVCGSANCCVCVVNGNVAMTACWSIGKAGISSTVTNEATISRP